ncbi:unnamed protein product, partial [Rotaria magnacalcarata]
VGETVAEEIDVGETAVDEIDNGEIDVGETVFDETVVNKIDVGERETVVDETDVETFGSSDDDVSLYDSGLASFSFELFDKISAGDEFLSALLLVFRFLL